MEFKIIEGTVSQIQSELNLLSPDYDIQIKGISSSQRDPQLGCGGIVVIFTIDKYKIVSQYDNTAKVPPKQPVKQPTKTKKITKSSKSKEK